MAMIILFFTNETYSLGLVSEVSIKVFWFGQGWLYKQSTFQEI